MFKPSIIHHRCGGQPARQSLAGEIGVACLNVHKNNQRPAFQRFFQEQMQSLPIDLVLLQEAAFAHQERFFLERFCYEAAPNLQLQERFYGVLTACDSQVINADTWLSFAQEIFIKTHKSTLITYYSLGEDQPHSLCVANIHAINFRGLRRYDEEMALLANALSHHQGPMILAGDLNSWSQRRLRILHKLCETLGLRSAFFANDKLVKRFLGHPLDHIFYRDLVLLESRCISSQSHSDHNMLYARFRTPVASA